MNNVILMGRLTRNPYINEGQHKTAKFTLAVQEGKREANFINCVAFDKQADIVEKYCGKGKQILVMGKIKTGKYQKQNGDTVYTTEVYANSIEFTAERNQATASATDGFETIEEAMPNEESLPFN